MTTSFVVNKKGWPVIDKDPDAVLDYVVDWTDWLNDISDTINTHTVTAVGCTVDSSSKTTLKVTAFISGGRVGEVAKATFRIVTVGLRTEERTIYFNIKQR